MTPNFSKRHPTLVAFKDLIDTALQRNPNMSLAEFKVTYENLMKETDHAELLNLCVSQLEGRMTNCVSCGKSVPAEGSQICWYCQRRIR